MINLTEFANFLQQLSTGSHTYTVDQIADELDRYADQLKQSAAHIRQHGNPYRSSGGAQDRVKMQVFGPNGELKQTAQKGNFERN